MCSAEYSGSEYHEIRRDPLNSERSQQIIQNALNTESEYGTVRVASIKDLIWMKRNRNSDQDQVDIKMLEKGKSETNR